MQAADKETDLYVKVQVATKQQRNPVAAYPHTSDLPVNQQVATQPQPIRMHQTCPSTRKLQPSRNLSACVRPARQPTSCNQALKLLYVPNENLK